MKDRVKTIGLLGCFIKVPLGLVLIYLAITHLASPFDFMACVFKYEVFTPTAGIFLATIVPYLELIIGICFLLDILMRGTYLILMHYLLATGICVLLALNNNFVDISYFTLVYCVIMLILCAIGMGVQIYQDKSMVKGR